MNQPVSVSGVWLRREGDRVVVLFERDGKWYRAISEHMDSQFSHIIEPLGMAACPVYEVTAPRAEGGGRGMFIAGAAAGVTPNRKRLDK